MASRNLQAEVVRLVRRWSAVGIIRAVRVVPAELKEPECVASVCDDVDDVAAAVCVRVGPPHHLVDVAKAG